MKTLFRLYLRKNDTIPAGAFDALVQAFPAWHDADRAEFSCDLPFHDPRAAQILDCLRSHGLKPSTGLKPATSHEFSVRLERTYDRKDFETAPAIQLNPVSRYHRLPPKESGGPLIVPTTEIKPKSRIMSGGYHQLLISDETKTAFETEDFAGIVFRPIELEGPARSVAKFQGTFWELDSTVVLPPMAPSMRFYHASSGDEVKSDAPPPFIYRDGPDFPEVCISPPELHFTKSAWAAMPPFDIARTCEKPMGHYGVPVVSPRLYRLMTSLKIASAWIPVRLVDESA